MHQAHFVMPFYQLYCCTPHNHQIYSVLKIGDLSCSVLDCFNFIRSSASRISWPRVLFVSFLPDLTYTSFSPRYTTKNSVKYFSLKSFKVFFIFLPCSPCLTAVSDYWSYETFIDFFI